MFAILQQLICICNYSKRLKLLTIEMLDNLFFKMKRLQQMRAINSSHAYFFFRAAAMTLRTVLLSIQVRQLCTPNILI